MNIRLYICTDANNKLDKTLESELVYQCNANSEIDILEPVINLNITDDTLLISYNYLYIVELGRYYFITSKNIVRNNLISLQCRIDVLQTYKEQIKLMQGTKIFSDLLDSYYSGLNIGTDVRYQIDRMNFEKSFPDTATTVLIAVNDR